jgi:DNA-binding MarR family transcriptional regulator
MIARGTPSLTQRLRDGIERLAVVLKADQWAAAGAAGLNPLQIQILSLLAGRGKAGMRVSRIAAHLGISQPTATDSILSLERKKLVERLGDPADSRATVARTTNGGRSTLRAAAVAASASSQALGTLNAQEQAELLFLIVKLIRSLQISGALPEQRMCVSCRYFRPNAHKNSNAPHHCDFVNAAFGAKDLRIDCGDHESAEPRVQAAIWKSLGNTSSDPNQAETWNKEV